MWDEPRNTFLHEMSGMAEAAKTHEKKQLAKQSIIEETAGSFSNQDKEALHTAMQNADTARKNKVAITSKEQEAIQKEFNKVIAMLDKLRDAKGDDGKALFSAQEVADEVLTPLVREGILPENFVIDKYSEVYKLVGAALERFKQTLDEAREEKEKAKGKTEIEASGGGTTMQMLGGLATKAGAMKDRVLAKINPLGRTEEEKKRSFAIETATITAVTSTWSAFSDTKDLIDGKGLQAAKDLLNNVEQEQEASEFFTNLSQTLNKLFGLKGADPGTVKEAIANAMTKAGEAFDALVDEYGVISNEQWYKITTSSLSLAYETVSGSIEIGSGGVELATLQEELEKDNSRSVLRKGAAQVVARIDAALKKVAIEVDPAAGAALGGAYTQKVPPAPIAEAAASDLEPESQKVIDLLAAGFPEAFALCAPDGSEETFKKIGTQIAASFKSRVKASALTVAIEKDAATAFDFVVAAAEASARKALGLLQTDPPEESGTTDALVNKLKDPEARKAMLKKVAEDSAPALMEEYERSAEEIAEYERQLVLFDETRVDEAKQRSVEKLIAEMKQDKKMLEMVASLGSTLTALPSGAVEIVGGAGKMTEAMVGQIVGPLSAAKLIVQLSVNIIKAVERWKLWNKFRKDLERAKIAVSALSTSIQGFFESKKEQIAFHTVEDAMLAVQFAGSVLGSIPEPITLAVGKVMAAVGTAGQNLNKVANLVFDEAVLRKGWAVTKAAMNNPKDRDLGLEALRLNGTLAMHAIAWAGLERKDPIARMVLDSCGLNENTLMEGDSTEKNVREYLTTLLDEDRQFLDTEQINTAWQPVPVTLTAKDWVIVVGRACRDATPQLRKGGTDAVLDALKKTDGHGDPKQLMSEALAGKLEQKLLESYLKEAEEALTQLNRYQPLTEDGSSHIEMNLLLGKFKGMAGEHKMTLIKIVEENKLQASSELGSKSGVSQDL